MFPILNRTKAALAVLALAASAGTAFAGEGNGPSFPGNQVPDVVLSQTVILPAPDGAKGAGRSTPALQTRQTVRDYWAQQAARAQQAAAPGHRTQG